LFLFISLSLSLSRSCMIFFQCIFAVLKVGTMGGVEVR
jgi:hypothetical protein